MNPFRLVTRAFIDAFGITHPTAKQESKAMWFICSMLGLIGIGAVALLVALHGMSQR